MAEQVQEQANQLVALFCREATIKWLRSTDNVRFIDETGQVISNKEAVYVDTQGYINVLMRNRCRVLIYLNHSLPPNGDLWKFKDPHLSVVEFHAGELLDSRFIPNVNTIFLRSVIVRHFEVNHLFWLRTLYVDSFGSPFIPSNDPRYFAHFQCSVINLVRHPSLANINFSTNLNNPLAHDTDRYKSRQALEIVKKHLSECDIVEAMDEMLEAGLKIFVKP
jgi:hypothetical protein